MRAWVVHVTKTPRVSRGVNRELAFFATSRVTRNKDMLARFTFDVLPAVELISRDSGAKETAYDMLADFVSIART